MTILALLCYPVSLSALDPGKATSQYGRATWSIEDGLPQNAVEAIFQSSQGYLWVGTQEGLARFDGVRFEIFDKSNTPAISSTAIFSMAEDREGNLWVGTDQELLRLREGHFTIYTAEDGFPNSIVRAIVAGDDGAIWIGTRGETGLFRFLGGTFTICTTADGLPGNSIRALAKQRDGTLWVGTEAGLARLDDGRFTAYTTADGLPNDHVNALLVTPDDTVWAGTENGLVRLKEGRFTTYTTADGLSHAVIYAIVEDRDGNLWIGTDGGLNRITHGVISSFQERDGLPGNLVRAIHEDREGSLWVGMVGHGLIRFQDVSFVTYSTAEGLSHDYVTTVCEDRAGNLWIGTLGGGLNRFRDGRFTVYTTADGLTSDQVWSLAEDRVGNLWIGTLGSGLNRFRDGRIEPLTHRDGLSNDFIRALLEDRDGSLWIGTYRGLNRLRDAQISVFGIEHGLTDANIYDLHEDRDGTLWIATFAGLCRSAGPDAFTCFTEADGLPRSTVLSIYEEESGSMWLSTFGGGLSRFHDGRFTTVTTREGLLNDTMFQILGDDAGNLWMSSDKGIFHIRQAEFRRVVRGEISRLTSTGYGIADGLKSFEASGGSQPAGWRSRDGRLWFPTTGGLSAVDPVKLFVNEVPPPVVIEQLLVDGTSVPIAGTIPIPAGAEKLEFRYTALSFRNPSRVLMRYQLRGYEREWVDAGTRRTAFYTSLPPGPYRFMVTAGNEDGVWNDVGAEVEIRIEPHVYQRPGFYLLCALAALGGATGLHQGRVRHLRRREQQLKRRIEEEVAKHQREAERRRKVEAQLLEAQKVESLGILAGGIAHQFNNLLVGILGNVDLALIKLMKIEERSGIRAHIEQIERAGLRAADLAAQMLAFSGKGRVVAEPIDLSDEIRDMADLLAASTSKKVSLTYDLASDLPAVDADVTQIRQLVMNLVINASEAIGDAQGTITITTGTMECDREYLSATHLNEDLLPGICIYLDIADSGCGMDQETRARLFEPFFSTKFTGRGLGLAVVHGIVRGHHGAVRVESEPYCGSKIRVLFPPSSQVPAPAAAGRAVSQPEWRGSGTVLLVDDEEPVRLTAQAMLETLGFDVLTATDGSEGVETYRRHRDDIRLVVLDTSMPRMGGIEALRELRRLHRDARIILCSGYSEREVTGGLVGDHLDGFLHKPYQLSTLREKIREVLDPNKQTTGATGVRN